MRAVVLERAGAPTNLRVADVTAREPGPREIRIAVRACGVCFHDVVVRNGTFRRGVEMPVILGHEVAGTVERLGAEVRGFRVGDLVATTIHSHVCGQCHNCRGGHETSCPERIFLGDAGLNGGYAELVCVDADAAVNVPACIASRDLVLVVVIGLPPYASLRVLDTTANQCEKMFRIVGSGAEAAPCAIRLLRSIRQ